MNGGYTMIDCKGIDLLSDSAQTKAGLYKSLQVAMMIEKPIFAYGMYWGTGKPITPIPVFAIQLLDDTIVCTSSTLQVWVNNEDSVEIHNMIGA